MSNWRWKRYRWIKWFQMAIFNHSRDDELMRLVWSHLQAKTKPEKSSRSLQDLLSMWDCLHAKNNKLIIDFDIRHGLKPRWLPFVPVLLCEQVIHDGQKSVYVVIRECLCFSFDIFVYSNVVCLWLRCFSMWMLSWCQRWCDYCLTFRAYYLILWALGVEAYSVWVFCLILISFSDREPPATEESFPTSQRFSEVGLHNGMW